MKLKCRVKVLSNAAEAAESELTSQLIKAALYEGQAVSMDTAYMHFFTVVTGGAQNTKVLRSESN